MEMVSFSFTFSRFGGEPSHFIQETKLLSIVRRKLTEPLVCSSLFSCCFLPLSFLRYNIILCYHPQKYLLNSNCHNLRWSYSMWYLFSLCKSKHPQQNVQNIIHFFMVHIISNLSKTLGQKLLLQNFPRRILPKSLVFLCRRNFYAHVHSKSVQNIIHF